MHSRFLATVLTGILASSLASCNNPTVTTPTRTLDRPSDVALYCVDIEVADCLPKIDPERDPEGYLAVYCDQGSIDYANNSMPTVKVLSFDDCDLEHRSQRQSDYFGPVTRAAKLTGRDPGAPCCPADNQTCSDRPPVCMRRMLSALVANTARGELAVADTESPAPGLPTTGRLDNLHGGQPGFGFLPTGLLPEHVRTFTPAGDEEDGQGSRYTWAVTANSGSCDLSVVDVRQVAQLAKRPNYCFLQGNWCANQSCDERSCPQRIDPWLPGPGNTQRGLRARPSWIEPAPWSQSMAGKRRTALVAYPTCGIVAAVDLGCQDTAAPDAQNTSCDHNIRLGRVLDAVGFDAMGKPRVLTSTDLESLNCAADCGGSSGGLMPDPNMLPDGGAPSLATFPGSFAIDAKSQRLLIGDSASDALTVVDFDPTAADGSRFRGTRSITLDFNVLTQSLRGGQKGVQSLRISPRTAAGQFAYAVGNDSSVRVIDLDREVECETNPEPRYLQDHASDTTRILPDELNASNQRRLSCFPVGTTPRSPVAPGPGMVLSNGSLPRDVGFVHVDAAPCDITDPNCRWATDAITDAWVPARTLVWVGDFAWLLGGAGTLTAVQVADACPGPSYRACFPDAAALRRVFYLHTRSQAMPNPETLNLPALGQALMVSPLDRITNVRRPWSRFEDQTSNQATNGPRTDSDSSGLPIFTARVSGTAVAYAANLSDPEVPAGRPRLTLPALAPYYYLPVDPVCDVAVADPALTFASPDGILPKEPTRRPVSFVNFVQTNGFPDYNWILEWEGTLAGLTRTTGKLFSDGTLTDLNGLYCNRGVESGDKLRLSGCQTDSDCIIGSICQREATQGTAPGICLTTAQRDACQRASRNLLKPDPNDPSWLATWRRHYRIVRSEQQVPVTGGDISDRLVFDEIAQPEFEIERESCAKLDDPCSPNGVSFAGRTAQTTPDYSCRVVGKTSTGTDQLGCVLGCQNNQECGEGYVCARSRYEDYVTTPPAMQKFRCLRAPILDSTTLRACFPDPLRYEVRGGDSFVVRGDRSGSPVLVKRDDMTGVCERPAPGDAAFKTGRLLEPRLRLGAHDLPDTDTRRCSRDLKDWIRHRVSSSSEANMAPSCSNLRGARRAILPLVGTEMPLVLGSEHRIEDAKDASDPWLKHEYELFSSLRLESDTNQCILSNLSEEAYPDAKAMASCVGLCRFPGDHTEALGVRRIHFETPYGNLVMRVPRVQIDENKTKKIVWSVPPDGYTLSFGIVGSLGYYEARAQSANQDISSGVLAQGLRSATPGPSGVLFIVDEGRTGGLTNLRGQVLRVVGHLVDPVFLLR